MLIAQRFCGPPDSGNGGYTAGLLAAQLGGGVVEVTLRKPPPLERELTVVRSGAQVSLQDDGAVVAEARAATLELATPDPVSFERATQISRDYHGLVTHHFPSCFGCGPARASGDGLRILPGTEPPAGPTAAPFVPGLDLGDPHGQVQLPFLWSALDCIGYFAVAGPDYPIAVLGRMTAEVLAPVRCGEECVVVGWPISREGRKLLAGTALFGADQALRGRAKQTWILL